MKIHIIATVYKRATHIRRLIYDFLCQTNQNWTLHIIQDGSELQEIKKFIVSLKDPRITFTSTDNVNGHFGFPNRNMMLQKIKAEPDDYILHTNDDNQYLPVFIETFLRNCNGNVGFIFCDTIHSGFGYGILHTQIRVGYIDMGSFIVRCDVARKKGFSQKGMTADGTYAEECATECRKRNLQILTIRKALFIHN